jgi:hypothetical protein
MWFNDIELPDELWRARDEDNLVIFAGAGVSDGPPSSLPLFSGLVERIAESSATADCQRVLRVTRSGVCTIA